VTAGLLERARQVGAGAFVFASTNAVVGDAGADLLDESRVLAPLTPYGATKAAAEMLMSAYTASYGIRSVALRFANVYGPVMSGKDSIVARLMRAAVSGSVFEIYGDGRQVRDYVFVGDIVEAIVLAISSESSTFVGPVVLGSASSATVLEIVELARKVTGAAIEVRHVPAKAGEMPAVRLDNAKALALGWKPTVALPEGLQSVWEWWRSAPTGTESGRSAPTGTESGRSAPTATGVRRAS
jgi:UDP-glucose 4-epimerase